ncbi:putative quinol monooxygenase [Zobellella sp. DQSA1]|uniref:putative quinol monooxygenase n=1 Tax=Zobellella sp. DQSA1 TaxID=3342386 RepID=UPI0035BEC573
MPKVVLKGFIIVPDADLDAVKKELVTHKKLTLEEAGCIIFEVTQCEKDPRRFNVYEEFKDKRSFEAHQARVKASLWGKVSENVKRHYEIFE